MTTLPDFITDGLCTQVDNDLFFPEAGSWTTVRAAQAVCARCPVVEACQEYALAHPEVEGIWGATTYRQRRRMRGAAA